MTENWKKIPGYEDFYEVSDLGRVRSLPRKFFRGGFPVSVPGKIKKQSKFNKYGYMGVQLWKGNSRRFFTVHSLVLLAFVGPRPEGYVCLHGSGGHLDNRLSNLRYGTKVENWQDMRDFGKPNYRPKLSDKDAQKAKQMVRSGRSQSSVARELGVSQQTIGRIVTGISYRWLNKDGDNVESDPVPEQTD